MNKKMINVLKKCMCVVMSLALVWSVAYFSNGTKTYAAKEQFQTTTDENYVSPSSKNFLMYTEDIYIITGRGVVLTGRVVYGTLKVGDKIKVTNFTNGTYTNYELTVEGIEMFRKSLDSAEAGDNVGIFVGWPWGEDAGKGDLQRGAVLQGTADPYPVSKTLTGVFAPVESGFNLSIGNGFEAQAYVSTTDFTCKVLDVNGSGIKAGDPQRAAVKIGEFVCGGVIVYPGMEISIRRAGFSYGTFTVVATEDIVEEPTTEEPTTVAPTNVTKKANTISVKAKTKKVKYAKIKKKKQVVSKAITVKNAQGTVTYKKVKKGSSSKLKINKKTGKITVKKKTKKGTYKINVKVTAAGNDKYLAASKTVTVKIKVK